MASGYLLGNLGQREHMYLEYQSFNRGLEGITMGRKTHGMNETLSHGIPTHKAFFQLQRYGVEHCKFP